MSSSWHNLLEIQVEKLVKWERKLSSRPLILSEGEYIVSEKQK